MEKRLQRLILAVLAVLLLVCGCSGSGNISATPNSAVKNVYDMALTLDDNAKTLSGTMTIQYHNPTGRPQSKVPFMLYPNAYSKESTAPFFASEMSEAYPNGFSVGGVHIDSLKVDGAGTYYTLGNDDSTLMLVTLPSELKSDATANIEIAFTVTLPNSLGRFGYGDKTVNLCNFYPQACAYDGQDFYTYPYYKAGDPFISDVADYTVTLTLPKGMTLAHTGTEKTKTEGDLTTYTMQASDVRDFAMVASSDFAVADTTVNGVSVKSYYYADEAGAGQKALSYGANAIKAYAKMYGDYAYKTFSVVQTDFFIGGMEYPQMVLIDQSLYDTGSEFYLEYVTAHETGHQWWWVGVGSNQITQPWLDEALTDYSTILYFGATHSEKYEDNVYTAMVEYAYEYYHSKFNSTAEQERVGQAMDTFTDMEMYSFVVYTNGTRMLRALEDKMGKDNLLKALSLYYRENLYSIADKQNLFDALKESSGQDWTSFFDDWL